MEQSKPTINIHQLGMGKSKRFPSFETTRYYAHELTHVWTKLIDVYNDELWYATVVGYDPFVGSQFTTKYYRVPGTRFLGIFDCEVLALVPPKQFVMSWRPRMASGQQPSWELQFELQKHGGGTQLMFNLSNVDLHNRDERIIQHMFVGGFEHALCRLGEDLDSAAATKFPCIRNAGMTPVLPQRPSPMLRTDSPPPGYLSQHQCPSSGQALIVSACSGYPC